MSNFRLANNHVLGCNAVMLCYFCKRRKRISINVFCTEKDLLGLYIISKYDLTVDGRLKADNQKNFPNMIIRFT